MDFQVDTWCNMVVSRGSHVHLQFLPLIAQAIENIDDFLHDNVSIPVDSSLNDWHVVMAR